MSVDVDLVSAFFERIGTLPAPAGDLPVLWPGLTTQRPASGMWLEPRAFPGDTENPFYGATSAKVYNGFYQIGVGFRPGLGVIAPRTVSAQIVAHFPVGLEFGGIKISNPPSPGSLISDGEANIIPVTIRYREIVAV